MNEFFFFDFQSKGGYVSAAVEVYDAGGNITGRTRVEMPAVEFCREFIDLGLDEYSGSSSPAGIHGYTYFETDFVFQAMHNRSPFPNLQTA